MSDDTEENKYKFKLKSIEDFKPEENKGSLFDFKKAKEKKEENSNEPKLETRFCVEYKENGSKAIFNFKVERCEDGYNMVYVAKRYMDTPFMSGWMEQAVAHNYVELTKWEKFLHWLHIGMTLEEKVEKEATIWKSEIMEHYSGRGKIQKLNDSFKL